MYSMKYDFIIGEMQWSYSRLTSFEQCHYGWLLHYVLHEPTESGFFAEYGSFVHLVIEQYLKGELEKDELVQYYMMHYHSQVVTMPFSPELADKYYYKGLKFFQTFDFPHKNIVAVEDRIEFDLGGMPFVGYIDVISEEDGELVITDHKSHDLKPFSRNYTKKKTKTDIELESYLRQLVLYAYGVKQKYGRYPKTLEFNCFKSGVMISIPFDESVVQPTIDWAIRTIQEITNESEWAPNIDYFFCKNLCDCRKSCEYVNEE